MKFIIMILSIFFGLIPLSPMVFGTAFTKYTVVIYFNNGQSIQEIDVYRDRRIKDFPDEPTYAGHEFAGWFYRGTESVFLKNQKITEDTFIEARWWKLFAISFDTMGAASILPVTIARAAALPDAPVWDGHIFEGWYFDKNFVFELKSDMVFYDDTTLYAKWVECE